MATQAISHNESLPGTKPNATIEISATPANIRDAAEEILTPEARRFLATLHREFHRERTALLNQRAEKAEWLRSGGRLTFPHETRETRAGGWQVAAAPADLRCRHVEITGPCEAKMMINALNSGADAFMADIEDSLSPTWENVLLAQQNLRAASRGELRYAGPDGREYRQNEKGATLLVRPRGWHLPESHFLVDGQPISASLFDFGLAFFHNAQALLARGSGPYFYLPKLESAREARLWNKVFVLAQDALGIPRGTIRATVLIETITAAFEMDEILWELREHASGLNAGRWDYLFSILKKFSLAETPFPDRARITMDLPFLRAYCELMVQTCHHRGAHAIGGMSAFIPSRKDPEVNRVALEKVSADKARELSIGFDGTWVAHPDLVKPVKALFVEKLGESPDQKWAAPAATLLPADLLPRDLTGGVTEQGVRTNLYVSLVYLHHWINGLGAVAIHNLMEDAATAEISRAQLWQWVRLGAKLDTGSRLTEAAYRQLLAEELARVQAGERFGEERARLLTGLMDYLVLHHEFVEFLTKPAYDALLAQSSQDRSYAQRN